MTPRTLFTWLARAEAVTWTLLLIGMWLKYLTRATDLGVRVFGLAHGIVFLAFLLVVLVLWVDQRWPWREAVLVGVAAVVPFATLWAERRVEARGLAPREWRLSAPSAARSLPERVVAAALQRPATAVLVAVVTVGVTTAVLVAVGPPPLPGRGA